MISHVTVFANPVVDHRLERVKNNRVQPWGFDPMTHNAMSERSITKLYLTLGESPNWSIPMYFQTIILFVLIISVCS